MHNNRLAVDPQFDVLGRCVNWYAQLGPEAPQVRILAGSVLHPESLDEQGWLRAFTLLVTGVHVGD